MNAAEFIRRLHREILDWKSYERSPEVSWTLQGLNRAAIIARALLKEERVHAARRRPRMARWLAADLYRAIQAALNQFKRGDRGRGIRTLEVALELVKKKRLEA